MLNPQVLAQLDTEGYPIRDDFYYHLDCFMQLLPDGRLVILNKNILLNSSWMKLQILLGDRFIDLSYLEYLTQPFIFNFIAIPKDDSFALISPRLPESVTKALSNIGLKIITPDTFDPSNKYFDREFACSVAKILRDEGYLEAQYANLTTNFSENKHGYIFNGKVLLKTDVDKITSPQTIAAFYKNAPLSFMKGYGGPHCLTIDLVPSIANSKNTQAFFNKKQKLQHSQPLPPIKVEEHPVPRFLPKSHSSLYQM